MTKRYMFNLLLDLDDSANVEVLQKILPREIKASPKVTVVSLTATQVRGPGRPAEIRDEILEYLETQTKARSALQISKKIMRVQNSLYKVLHELQEEGQIIAIRDGRYNVNRWALKREAEEMESPW